VGRNARYMINERQAVDLLLPKVYFMRKIVITRIQKWAVFKADDCQGEGRDGTWISPRG